jgi:hypothetical protein
VIAPPAFVEFSEQVVWPAIILGALTYLRRERRRADPAHSPDSVGDRLWRGLVLGFAVAVAGVGTAAFGPTLRVPKWLGDTCVGVGIAGALLAYISALRLHWRWRASRR